MIAVIAMLVFTAAMPVVASDAPATASTAPLHLQYDVLGRSLRSGEPIPPPAAFEQEYAAAMKLYASTPSLATQYSGMSAASRAVSAGVKGALVSKGLQSIGSHLGPLGGMAASLVGNSYERHRQKKSAARMHKLMQASLDYAKQATWRPHLKHVAIWDHWLRIDNVDMHKVTIYKPAMHRYLVLDTSHKTYRRLDAPPQHMSMGNCSQPPAPTTALGERSINGMPTHGYRYAYRLVSGANHMVISSGTRTEYASDIRLPTWAEALLAPMTTCPPGSLATRHPTHPLDRLDVYSTTVLDPAGPMRMSLGQMPSAPSLPRAASRVRWIGHLHTLTAADRSLFQVPAGYTQVH